jgi:hypothetical protein
MNRATTLTICCHRLWAHLIESYGRVRPYKAMNLTFDRFLPALPLRSVAVKRRLWQR